MLRHFVRWGVKPFYLGIDWQVDNLRMVLLGYDTPDNKAHKKTYPAILGQWHVSLTTLLTIDSTETPPAWQAFITQMGKLVGVSPVHVSVGIPNRLCTWLHCPPEPLKGKQTPDEFGLHYQRTAAAALNIEPINLRVCHLQLSSNLSFLVVTKRRYDDQIGQLLTNLHEGIEGDLVAALQPQGLTQVVFAPKGADRGQELDDKNAMAWFMANRLMAPSC